MEIYWIGKYKFLVDGIKYIVNIPVPIVKYKEDCITKLQELYSKKDYYIGLLNKISFSDAFLNKAPMEIILDKIKIEEDTYRNLFQLTEIIYEVETELTQINSILENIYKSIIEKMDNYYPRK